MVPQFVCVLQAQMEFWALFEGKFWSFHFWGNMEAGKQMDVHRCSHGEYQALRSDALLWLLPVS